MTSAAPWSVKGIDPKAREIAKDLARRSGLTLGEWLNQVIYEDNAQTELSAPPLRVVASVDRPASENRTPRRAGDDLERVLSALRDLSDRFDASLEHQAETSARFERAIADLKTDQVRVSARLGSVERDSAAGSDSKVATLRALEVALNKVAGHMASGESRHREAMTEMRRELSEEMGRVAGQMHRQVLEVENRGVDAIAQVSAEVSRVATAVEQRLRKVDDTQAAALERLGSEIARITERLSERITAAERRSTHSVDEVGEQIARMADRIHARQERHETDLADRMRQSEERTAKWLEEARQTIDRRLLRVGVTAAEEAPASSAFVDRWTPVGSDSLQADGADGESTQAPPAGVILGAAANADYVDHDDESDRPAGLVPPSVDAEPEEAALNDQDAMAAVARAIQADSTPAVLKSWDAPSELGQGRRAATLLDPDVLRPSTHDLVAEGRLAAFAGRSAVSADDVSDPSGSDDSSVTFPNLSQRRPKPSHPVLGVLLAGGAAASIGLVGAGYVALHSDLIPGQGVPAAKPIPVAPSSPPNSIPPPTPAPVAHSDTADVESLYKDAAARVDSGDPTGVASLRMAANLNYAPAQRLLGALYEDGRAGVAKDPGEGHRWNQRAAANGDARGMHNLALDYFEGTGVKRNAVAAAEYFGRAAQLGLRDSQFNLAQLYERGEGVQRDLAAAYQWYLIAAGAGDAQAASLGAALKAQLAPDQAARAEAKAKAFRPDPASPPQSLTAGLRTANPRQLALAARALTSLGYYKGADDGAPSQALGQAIQAYQRDRGLAQNGQLSPELVQTFAHISQ